MASSIMQAIFPTLTIRPAEEAVAEKRQRVEGTGSDTSPCVICLDDSGELPARCGEGHRMHAECLTSAGRRVPPGGRVFPWVEEQDSAWCIHILFIHSTRTRGLIRRARGVHIYTHGVDIERDAKEAALEPDRRE